MEVRWPIMMLIICASIVTFVPRVLPLMVLSRIQLADWVLRWLKHIPIAVMAALVGQELLMPGEKEKLSLSINVESAAALIAFLVAIKTRSLLWTVIAGVICTMVLRMLFH